MRIDAHQHFWNYNADDYGWIGGDMEILKKNYLPEDLLPLLQSNCMNGTIAVQARQTLEETRWLLDLANENPFIKGVVGWVDLSSPNVVEQLTQFCGDPAFVGVRHVVQDEPDLRFMLRREFLRGIEALREFKLTYDILIFPEHLPVAYEMVKKFPQQLFVVDHIAKPAIRDYQFSPWDEHIRLLASCPNVFCKISGMVTEADWNNWQYSDFEPYLDTILEAFGVDRIMIGSDWPVCTVSAPYDKVMQIVFLYIGKLTEFEQNKILGENGLTFYQIDH
ncbi:amidohydrolase family protein [candidate division KSB1 bacterium]|nr:amidohydrolase family protein [candidate division KSB1 bacterium]